MGEVIDVNAPAWLSPEGALLIGRDTVTGSAFYPPRPLAPGTLNVADAVAASGKGRIYAFSAVRRMGPDVFVLAMVTLEEGPTLLTRIVDCTPETIVIGAEVSMLVRDLGGAPAPCFALLT